MDLIATLGSFAQAHDHALVVVHLGVLAAALIWARGELREELGGGSWRFHGSILGAAALALLVSAVVIPAFTRHGWEGHESFYLDIFLGRDNEEMHSSPLLTAPLLRVLYLGLAAVPGMPPTAMVAVNLLFGAAAVWIAAQLGRALTGHDGAGVVTGVLVALHPHQACWASSAYQIILPFGLTVGAVLAVVLGVRRSSARLYVVGVALWTLAVGTRIEVVFLGPGLAAIVLLGGKAALRDWRAWGLGVVAAAGLGALHVLRLAGTVAERDAGEPWAYYIGYFREHVLWLDLWHPYGSVLAWPALGIGAYAMVRSGRRGRMALAGIAAVVLTFHLPYTVYYDYTTRHTLLSVVLLAVVAAAGVDLAWRNGGAWRVGAVALALGCVVPSLITLGQYRGRYYGEPERLAEAVEASAWETKLELGDFMRDGCYLITEWPPLWERTACGSHVNMADPLDRPEILDEHDGCVIWLYDVDNVLWTSRDVHMRAAKLEWLYDWELIGSITLDDGYEAGVRRLVL
jgi:hypothetical protein